MHFRLALLAFLLPFTASAASATATPGFTLSSSLAAVNVDKSGTESDTISVTGTGGFTGTVQMVPYYLPSGVTATFGTNPTSGSTVVTFAATSTAALGTTWIVIEGYSGSLTSYVSLPITVVAAGTAAAGFSVQASAATVSLAQGASGAEGITFVPANGFNGTVTFTVSGLPTGVTGTLSANPVTGTTGSSTLNLAVAATAKAATATVTITGTSGSLSATTTFSLAITAPVTNAAGYWHTSGNQVLDSNNNPVRIASINWYGFEGVQEVLGGLESKDYHTILQTVKNLGYNSIRMPYSNQMVETPIVPTQIQTSGINQDLAGLNSLQIMDKVVAAAGQMGISIILDNHRSEAGETAEANGLWYTAQYPEANWLADWAMLAKRYAGNPAVIGMDLRNEPHGAQTTGACWGCGSTTTDWRLAAERGGNAILAANPNLLLFVEGNDCFGGGECDWWGGNLKGVASYPVVVSTANRVVYSPHEYGPDLYVQPWFTSTTTMALLESNWNTFWGYIYTENIAPIWLGEFGTPNDAASVSSAVPGSEGQWFQGLVTYLQMYPGMGWGYWAVNGEDAYALLDTNYDPTPVSAIKQSMLASIEPATSSATPSFTIVPTATSLSINPGASVTDTVLISGSGGFNGSATLAVSGLPAGVTAIFSTNPVTSTTVLTLTASATATIGTATLTITGTSGSVKATTTIPLTVAKANAGFACSVSYSITSQWQGNFNGSVTILNTGTVAVSSWTLTWTYANGQTISSEWNATESQNGANVTLQSLSYNGAIPAGGSVTGVGFAGTWNNVQNAVPASFTVNGTVCH